MSFETQEAVVAELEQYAVNEAALYPQRQSIEKSLATKKARGEYKHALAVKAFGYFVEAGAKKYAKEFGGTWHKMFDVPTRRAVAENLTTSFEEEYKLGNYDRLLPKKYQKQEKASASHHATKKVKWKVPEGIKVAWSPVNQAYFVLWPSSAPLQKQQVLKIADADEMHSWLREKYGEPYGRVGGRVGAARAHSTVASSYARKRSLSQLDREIANVVPSWRGR